ncbi:Ethylene-responsive transcription factor ERF118 [Camellia lanceoleosa]|uniref:Ethylene-responsive transcription factor ERF118 n=1 Tax=Camellia lanceoleosa TaxID=1840588 RepID=A0ACC0FMT6_9ERIC|nr:Ethylene-responsive transcription factor ERF118 [Camellia lanceoleosa]
MTFTHGGRLDRGKGHSVLGFSHKTKRIRIICYDPYATDSLFIDDFGHLFDDFGSLDDLQIFGFEDNEPSDLPDFDFELGNEEFA